jgi:hypothetical protein
LKGMLRDSAWSVSTRPAVDGTPSPQSRLRFGPVSAWCDRSQSGFNGTVVAVWTNVSSGNDGVYAGADAEILARDGFCVVGDRCVHAHCVRR